ncbi:Six-hairpin glycosidase [Penicillium robsamsonii]|uniref:Six-hairpin glycosidase n=1 Tax=Penicillium robsamsonii TaxID=1792511 RepID=UPI0025480CD9|nr:Six-hairpin glycosidase [Penicillium robsamsonii]KAJ5823764.1 Six-hairpin glycosidase [Penicillium robsamsonii]
MFNNLPAFAVAILAGSAAAIDLKINDEQSIKNAAATAAFNTMSTYTSNITGNIPGKLDGTWWRGAVLFQTMIEYWYFTGDSSNNKAVSQGMYWQRGDNNYFPSNYSQFLGNDDQVAWGLAAMTAAELEYTEDPSKPSWLTLADGVFQSQIARWDTESCDGGLRWQIFPYQDGYDIKNAMSNGGLFQLSARLARYTENQTYSDWAEKIWDWSASVPILNTTEWTIGDVVDVKSDCKTYQDLQWTYSYGEYISGAAYMYNLTNGETSKWKSGLDGLLNTSFHKFFPEKYGGKIMVESSCETVKTCNQNQEVFKGLFASDLAGVTRMAPHTKSEILQRLQGSAVGAAKQCSGGDNGTVCGQQWYKAKWDGTAGMEAQLSATSVFTSNLVAFEHMNLATKNTSTSTSTTQNASSTPTETQGEATSGTKDNGGNIPRSQFGSIGLVLLVSVLVLY